VSKLKLKLDDPHTLLVWQAAQRAKAEVASWPAWKRGEYDQQKRSSMNDETELLREATEALEGLLALIDPRAQMKAKQQGAYFRAKQLVERLRDRARNQQPPNGVP
jgi:hypothetical protein